MTPRTRPTAEHVLAILQDQHRHGAVFDPEADPDIVLTASSTIEDWRRADDLLEWKDLSRALNQSWQIDLSPAEWHHLLEPSRQRTLGPLCAAIAARTEIETPPARGLLGCTTPASRAFLFLRDTLIALGLPKHQIRPSTPAAPLIDRYDWKLLGPAIRIAPGAFPTLIVTGTTHRAITWTTLIFFIAGFIILLYQNLIGIPLLLIGGLLLATRAIRHPRFRGTLTMPGAPTLRDLANLMAPHIH